MRDADAAREYAVDAEAEQISAQHIVIGHQSRKAAGNDQHGNAVIADGAQVSGNHIEEGGRRMSRYGSDGIGLAERLDERRSEEHTSELQSLIRNSYAVFCLKQKTSKNIHHKSLRK